MHSYKNTQYKIDLYFQEPIIEYARQLRKDQTKAEEILWNILRGRKFHDYKFRRQHPVSNLYILDFYCFENKLAIELDGPYHQEELQKQKDDERTNVLKLFGIRVLRFTNAEVINRTNEVLDKILEALKDN